MRKSSIGLERQQHCCIASHYPDVAEFAVTRSIVILTLVLADFFCRGSGPAFPTVDSRGRLSTTSVEFGLLRAEHFLLGVFFRRSPETIYIENVVGREGRTPNLQPQELPRNLLVYRGVGV